MFSNRVLFLIEILCKFPTTSTASADCRVGANQKEVVNNAIFLGGGAHVMVQKELEVGNCAIKSMMMM